MEEMVVVMVKAIVVVVVMVKATVVVVVMVKAIVVVVVSMEAYVVAMMEETHSRYKMPMCRHKYHYSNEYHSM
jgi:hypothetical protein